MSIRSAYRFARDFAAVRADGTAPKGIQAAAVRARTRFDSSLYPALTTAFWGVHTYATDPVGGAIIVGGAGLKAITPSLVPKTGSGKLIERALQTVGTEAILGGALISGMPSELASHAVMLSMGVRAGFWARNLYTDYPNRHLPDLGLTDSFETESPPK